MTQWGLDTLFNPSKRHMDEEKARLQSTREEVGDASGGKRIDLDSGRVRISRANPQAAAEPGVEADGDPALEGADAATDAATAATDVADIDPAVTAHADTTATDPAVTAHAGTADLDSGQGDRADT